MFPYILQLQIEFALYRRKLPSMDIAVYDDVSNSGVNQRDYLFQRVCEKMSARCARGPFWFCLVFPIVKTKIETWTTHFYKRVWPGRRSECQQADTYFLRGHQYLSTRFFRISLLAPLYPIFSQFLSWFYFSVVDGWNSINNECTCSIASFCDAAVIGYIMWFVFLVGFTGFRFEDRGASLQDGIT